MKTDSSLRVMLYCAAKSDMNNYAHDVAFPSQLEVKIGDNQVTGNFKGLKNKPGSTRPVDITGYLSKQPNKINNLVTTYALTQKVGETPSPQDAQVRNMNIDSPSITCANLSSRASQLSSGL